MYSSNYSPSPIRGSTAKGENSNYQSESFHREFYQTNSHPTVDPLRYPTVGLSNSTLSLSSTSPRLSPAKKYPREYTTTLNDPNQYRGQYGSTTSNHRAYSYDDLHREDQTGSRRALNIDPDEEIVVKSTDLASIQEQNIIELVGTAFRKYDITNQRELAGFLKRSADQRFSSCWHCIVGRQFSSYVTHEMNGFIYMTRGPLSILLFKSGP